MPSLNNERPDMTITEDQRLQAFALYTMAKHHNEETGRYYNALARMLGLKDRSEDPGHISDSIWGFDNPPGLSEFDEMLRRMGVTVQKPEAA